jgi:segregation and condensation protein B
MDYFGINTADELPKINEVLMEELVKATIINPEHTEEDISEENQQIINPVPEGMKVDTYSELVSKDS